MEICQNSLRGGERPSGCQSPDSQGKGPCQGLTKVKMVMEVTCDFLNGRTKVIIFSTLIQQ